jgi:hypothetical protein
MQPLLYSLQTRGYISPMAIVKTSPRKRIAKGSNTFDYYEVALTDGSIHKVAADEFERISKLN